jgi:hypothetical protein
MRSKRQKRRRAWREREYQNQYAINLIHQDYMWASSTWGGTRCVDCGLKTEPRYQLGKKFTYYFGCGRSWGILPVCDRVNNCPGEIPDWEIVESRSF